MIAFDIDDTLYDLRQPFLLAVRDVFGNAFDGILPQVFLRIRIRGDERFREFSCGEIPQEEYFCWRNIKGFEDCGIRIKREEALVIQKRYEEHQQQISMSDVITSMLQELKKRGTVTGIISNGISEAQRKKARTLGIPDFIPEERIIISGDIGHAKPSREIFDFALEKLLGAAAVSSGSAAENYPAAAVEAWYVGDTYVNDIEGAAGAGWHTIWFNRRHLPVPDSPFKPDLIVSDEAELAAVVLKLALTDVSNGDL